MLVTTSCPNYAGFVDTGLLGCRTRKMAVGRSPGPLQGRTDWTVTSATISVSKKHVDRLLGEQTRSADARHKSPLEGPVTMGMSDSG